MRVSKGKQNVVTTNEQSLTLIKQKNCRSKSKKYLCSFVFIGGFIFFSVFCVWWINHSSQIAAAESSEGEIEKATFTRQEFFGVPAFVPLPTAEARENLAQLAAQSPDNPQILEKLADFNEKLLRFDEAEKTWQHLAEIDDSKLETLADFYERRAQFAKEAETLKRQLFSSGNDEQRAAAFERLIETAQKHDLKEYLQVAFDAKIIQANPQLYPVFEKLVDNLTEERNYPEALNLVRQAKSRFPAQQNILLEKEIEILLAADNGAEAEKVYQAAFDPFWTETEAQKFYDFLSGQDRLRAYGAEIKARFEKNPADFDAAIRLALYQNHDFRYGNDEITPLILKLEASKKSWTTEELVTVSRLLLQANEADTASRFLYTLYLREDFKANSALRAKILYQLFEMFSDAGNQRLPLTKGDLRFYEDVARADINPGITTGILSLIFSDSNPRQKFDEQETKAAKLFNRAAAFRIFEEYKRENPASAELAQMYLDIVRLYTATKETEIAAKTLNEFAGKYGNSPDFPAAALKLADAFSAVKNEGKARQVYQKTLDYLGKQGKLLPLKKVETINSSNESNAADMPTQPARNDGINIPSVEEKPDTDDYYADETPAFRDYLGRKNAAVSYAEVLEKYIASLAKEKKTAEILQLYSAEIAKYPNEEWLYEQRLAWLEQTNLMAEQLKVYQTALARFQTNGWRDKLARFFVRNKRDAEFAGFSADLIGKLNAPDTQNYLSEFIDGKVSATAFEQTLYLKLYQAAHTRFPHNISFVSGLLRFYQTHQQEDEWRKLSAEYYFESPEIRRLFLDDLAKNNRLREYLAQSQQRENTIYELFRADASARLSDFENAVAAYRKLNESYPNTPEFADRLINFTRSFGQKNRQLLQESANVAVTQADFLPASAEYRTRSGEIYAELGDYGKAREQWEKLIATATGDRENYLATATVYWDYFQYADARRTIQNLREKFGDATLYAFETGAILEAEDKEPEAVKEYVKAFDAKRDETQKEKAVKRLAQLASRETRKNGANEPAKNQLENAVASAFASEREKRKDSSFLALGYAEFLAANKQDEPADEILRRAIGQSADKEFLEAAKNFYQTKNNNAGKQIILARLAETVKNPRQSIAYRLQLADSLAENRQRDAAKTVLAKLVRQFPTNYGVLTETSNFYHRLGFESEAAQVLENALPPSRGAYRLALAQKLAQRLIELNRLDSAERILANLHTEDQTNLAIFHELARVYVRTNAPDKVRAAFAETVAALKNSDADRRETETQIADLRTEMIDAFTKLKDYQSAVAQHIEIINREPENEELTENAISYVKRYGGAEILVNYYEKTAAEAFKNYRWNVVLARIYEARKDDAAALKNYRAALVNQPEMSELYLAIAALETKRGNYGEALKNIDEVLKISGDEAQYINKKIEILQKAGRFAEIAAEKAKLPAAEEVKANQFAEARKLQSSEKEKARDIYRTAFTALLENPLRDELKTTDITGYVAALHETESLDKLSENLWLLREKLTAIADAKNSTDAGEAKKRRSILDGALPEAIGAAAKISGTEEERQKLHTAWRRKIEETAVSDRQQILLLMQNLSRRAGFGDLEEIILIAAADNSGAEKPLHLRNLINFYNERGAYQKTLDALEKYGSDDLALKAEMAKISGNQEKELVALRVIYRHPAENFSTAENENVKRYLEILAAENPDELESLTKESSVYQLQLINFLLGKNQAELAHAAIESANLTKAWKVSRHAETSLALREFDENSECYFCAALKFSSIGEMVKLTPDKQKFLINDDWFRLTREYGEWLFEKKDQQIAPSKYLTAMIENQPRNPQEQFKLGEFYLAKNELTPAIEHLRLAVETENRAVNATAELSALGAAYYKIGQRDYAAATWAQISDDDSLANAAVYFQTLQNYGLSAPAREKIAPQLVKFLETNNANNSEDFQALIRAVAASFTVEAEKTAYFQAILRQRPADVSLAAMLVNENLIGRSEQAAFYELLISRSQDLNDADYNFKSVAAGVWAKEDAESVYEQENEDQTAEPENEKYEWQKKYLERLITEKNDQQAGPIIREIEAELNNRYARPAWLREAQIRLAVRAGKFNRAEIERFIGITVSDAATAIKVPSVERFNEVRQILYEENHAAEAVRLSTNFFARMLALGQFNQANYGGLARAFFQNNEPEKALHTLRVMIAASDENNRETALAEVAAIDEVKLQTADAAKIAGTENTAADAPAALKLAAEIAFEFQQTEAAIAFRRQLLDANPADSVNKIELAKILAEKGESGAAENLLTQIINDKNSLRTARWQARSILQTEMPNVREDALSQFYQGILAEKSAKSAQNEAATEFFINALIADQDAETTAKQELIKLYCTTGKPFAALRLAETDKSAKSDELLEKLSETAEKVGDFGKAIEFENAQSKPNAERIAILQKLADAKNKRTTEFKVDSENTRKL